MGYSKVSGRRPYERASRITHSEIVRDPGVITFLEGCTLPALPAPSVLQSQLVAFPPGSGSVRAVIAVDGGLTEGSVRDEYPSATFAFMTFGPLLLNLDDLRSVDRLAFIGPEDMARLKNIQRYMLVLPTRTVLPKGAKNFSEGVRRTVHNFLVAGDGHLMAALRWLAFHGWEQPAARVARDIPRCPAGCGHAALTFTYQDAIERSCPGCGRAVLLSDVLRLYERIDDDAGAGGILGYLLTALEQLVIVHLIQAIIAMKPATLREVLFIRDGPLAFFGVTAPLHAPMRELMAFLGRQNGGPLIHLVGLEKSGPFVEHAMMIDDKIGRGQLLMLGDDYIYRHIQPGDPTTHSFGRNTYYGAKCIAKTLSGDVYVATVPTRVHMPKPVFTDTFNLGEVLRVIGELRCSMYDNALLPVVLANRLVSLADVPSSQVLAKFAAGTVTR